MIMADDLTYPDANKLGSSAFGLPHEPGFEVSDFFEFNDWVEEDPSFSSPLSAASYNPQSFSYTSSAGSSAISSSSFLEGAINSKLGFVHMYTLAKEIDLMHYVLVLSGDSGTEKKEMREKVAFKTKSEVEVLDDGFKWRKYGKKMVKNSPNPRYACINESTFSCKNQLMIS